jgi:hypothetical protein
VLCLFLFSDGKMCWCGCASVGLLIISWIQQHCTQSSSIVHSILHARKVAKKACDVHLLSIARAYIKPVLFTESYEIIAYIQNKLAKMFANRRNQEVDMEVTERSPLLD